MFNYYEAPSQDIFDDIKENSIKIWETYDDTYGYASEKINHVNSIENFKDNVWFIVAMFDWQNQMKLITMVKLETAQLIHQALNYNG